MHPSRMAAILLRQFYLMRGSPARILPLFAWVGVDMLLWGFMTRYLNSVNASGPDFVTALLGAVLLWNFFIRVMQGVTTAFLEDVWSRNFLNIFGSPLTVPEYVGGLVLTSIVTSAVGVVAMILLATLVFRLDLFAYGVLLIPFVLILFLFGIALGVLASAIVLRLGPAAEWFVWPIPALISPFVGVLYPLSTLPVWMQHVSLVLPPSYVFEGLRSIVRGASVSGTGLASGIALAAVDILLAGWFFVSTYRHAVRTGLIARYSAESLS